MEKGTITIRRLQKTKTDNSFILEGAVLARFMNVGQTAVLIDEQIYLGPGETLVEGDLSGPGIDHSYQLDFVTVASPPTPVTHKVFTGNMLKIRLFHRKK